MSTNSYLVILCLVSLFLGSQQATQQTNQGGLKVLLHQRGLKYAADIAVKKLTKNVVGSIIKNVEGEANDFRYKLENIKIVEFVSPVSNIQLNEAASTMTWSLNNGNVRASTDWNYRYRKNRFIKFSDSGSTTVSADMVGISATFNFQFDPNTGKPKVHTSHCEAAIEDIDLHFHGGNGWIYNLLSKVLDDPIKDALKDALCDFVRSAVDEDANEKLNSLDTNVSLDNNMFLDYRLTSAPSIKSGALEFLSVGCVYVLDKTVCPQNEQPMFDEVSNKMIAIMISENSLNSYVNSMFISNQMKYYLTKEDFDDSNNKKILDIDCKKGVCFANIIHSKLPEVKEGSIEIDYKVLEVPNVQISTSNMWCNVKSRGIIKFKFANGTTNDLLGFHLSVILNISITQQNNIIGFQIASLKPNVDFEENIEEDVKAGVNFGIKAITSLIRFKVNEIGKKGVPLPQIEDVILENSQIIFRDHFIIIQSNAKYIG